MLFLRENISLLLLFLLCLLMSLIVYFFINYKQTKLAETNRLSFLYKELDSEEKTAMQLKKVPQEIKNLSKKTNLKFQKIKVDVLDLDFTLSELF